MLIIHNKSRDDLGKWYKDSKYSCTCRAHHLPQVPVTLRLNSGEGTPASTIVSHSSVTFSVCESVSEMALFFSKHSDDLLVYSVCFCPSVYLLCLLFGMVQFFVLLPNKDDKYLAVVNAKFGDHLPPWFPQRHHILTLAMNAGDMTT